MRRKTFDVLFEPKDGMTLLVKSPCLWRSAWYYTLSVGFFSGVITNTWLLTQPLEVRLAVIAAVVLISATALVLYGFLLHGISETLGTLSGDPKGLICLLGYTALPFLVLTPVALLAGKLGFGGMFLLGGSVLIGFVWMLYLLMHAMEVVYLIDFTRAAATVLVSLLLMYIVFVLPWQIIFYVGLRFLS